MKGLLAILGSKGPPKLGDSKEMPAKEPAEDAEESETGSSEKEYARLASEAIADGDHDTAADALVSLVKACSRSYGGEK